MKHVPVSVRPENMIVIEQDDHRGELNFHPPPLGPERDGLQMDEGSAGMKRYGGERSGDLRGLVVRAGQVGHGGAGVEVMDPSWLMTARLRGAVSGVNTRSHAASIRCGCA